MWDAEYKGLADCLRSFFGQVRRKSWRKKSKNFLWSLTINFSSLIRSKIQRFEKLKYEKFENYSGEQGESWWANF